jgi:uncharacterized phage protein (TIGR01671 family)
MNRVIKFRAWDGEKKTMYIPYILSFVENKVSSLVLCDDGNRKYIEHKLMQFTGLQDANGVDIYEGDFVKHDAWDYPFEIIFNNEKARFVCKMKTGLTQYISNKEVVVVGNIHENPELIKL